MPTKKQHFVPRVYMKAWETKVETSKEPNKKINGVYVFNDSDIGEGVDRMYREVEEAGLPEPEYKTVAFMVHATIKNKKYLVEDATAANDNNTVPKMKVLMREQNKFLIFVKFLDVERKS